MYRPFKNFNNGPITKGKIILFISILGDVLSKTKIYLLDEEVHLLEAARNRPVSKVSTSGEIMPLLEEEGPRAATWCPLTVLIDCREWIG